MQKILVLGAGHVSKPMIEYLLNHSFQVTVTSLERSQAEAILKGNPNGKAVQLDIANDKDLEALVQEHDLVVSLLPFIFHVKVARFCLAHRKSMVTTSYISPEMAQIHEDAVKADILILNEIGLDPGLDHLSAQKIIDDVHAQGGKITKFHSCCGGIPALESLNNPFGYKFSWNPKGVLMAGRNSARYLHHGQEVFVVGRNLFNHYGYMDVPGIGRLEYYPNRDSVKYREIYRIPEVQSLLRGTLRYPGWCQTLKKLVDMNWLEEIPYNDATPITYNQFMIRLVGGSPEKGAKTQVAQFFGLPVDAESMVRMEWLGLFSNDPVPMPMTQIDILLTKMMEKLAYKEGEKDMIVLTHEFAAEYPNRKQTITSTLIETGDALHSSAMSRTVSLPAAIAVRLILEKKITLKGVYMPAVKEVYQPILDELPDLGLRFKETIAS